MKKPKPYKFIIDGIRDEHILPFQKGLSSIDQISQVSVYPKESVIFMMSTIDPERFVKEMCDIYYLKLRVKI